MTIWTIGHSTRSIDDFLALLRQPGVITVADVRRFPGSRRHPQFGQDALAMSLAEAAIGYEHFPELGGRRRARKDSPNTAWRNAAFRGYADYMMTNDFRAGVDRLVALAARGATAIMCAESLWWQCHRSLISDYLETTGHEVIHIMGAGKLERHRLTSPARVVEGVLTYSPQPDLLG